MNHFPCDASGFLESCQRRVLEALVTAIGGIAPPRDVDGILLKDHLQTACRVTQALQAMLLMRFDDDPEDHRSVDFPEPSTFKKQKTSRKQPKRGLPQLTQERTFNPEVFGVLQVGVPMSRKEWHGLVDDFLTSQRDSLGVWFTVLRPYAY